jgi:hypothetical protein
MARIGSTRTYVLRLPRAQTNSPTLPPLAHRASWPPSPATSTRTAPQKTNGSSSPGPQTPTTSTVSETPSLTRSARHPLRALTHARVRVRLRKPERAHGAHYAAPDRAQRGQARTRAPREDGQRRGGATRGARARPPQARASRREAHRRRARAALLATQVRTIASPVEGRGAHARRPPRSSSATLVVRHARPGWMPHWTTLFEKLQFRTLCSPVFFYP